MAKLVRQHPTLVSLLGALAVGAILIWWASAAPAPARATPAAAAAALLLPPPLDPVIAGEIATLRDDVGLGNDVLNVLNLETPAELLTALKTWHTGNREELSARRTALADLRGEVRRLRAAVNNGQDEASALATARANLAQAEAAFETFLQTMRNSVFENLTGEQREIITRMHGQRNLPMPYRALPLTEEQSRALRAALLSQEQRRSTARTDERRAEVLTIFEQERDSTIGATNLQALASLQSYLGASSARVVAALNEVLPSPEE